MNPDDEREAPKDAAPSTDLEMIGKALEVLANLNSKQEFSDRVQFARDRLAVAACERAARIFRADLDEAKD